MLALWGAKGVVGELYDVLETWRDKARDVQGTALPCGHAIPEEVPSELTQAMLEFFGV
jgi:haloacetate dehalogenase